jgi:hypothetical protein
MVPEELAVIVVKLDQRCNGTSSLVLYWKEKGYVALVPEVMYKPKKKR